MSQNVLNAQQGRNAIAHYEGHLSSSPLLMVGRLMLNPKYLAFHIYDVRTAGILDNSKLVSTGRVLAIPIDRIVDVSVEQGVRSKKSRPNWKNKDDFQKKVSGERPFNVQPNLLDSSEKFSQLVITAETENGVEIAVFEVDNPQHWQQMLRAQLGKMKV